MTFTSEAEARAALRSATERRDRALAEGRRVTEAVTNGDRPGDAADDTAYRRAADEMDEAGRDIRAARAYLDRVREDRETEEAFAASFQRAGFAPNQSAPKENDMTTTVQPEVRYGRAFGKGQGFSDFVPEERRQSLAEAGRYIRAMLLDDVSYRATLAEGTDTLGGHFVPVEVLAPLLDLARDKTVLAQAGVSFVPLSSMTAKMPTHDADPVFAARAESGALAAADTTLGAVTFTPRSYAALAKASEELLEDSGTDVDLYLANVLAEAAARSIQQQALYGSGVAPNVKGVKNVTGVVKTHMTGNDGGDLVNYDPLVDLVSRVRTANYEVSALITSPGLMATMGKFREGAGTGGYLAPPQYLQNLQWLDTSAVPTNLVVGASGAVCTDVFAGDWSKVAIGLRQELRIRRLNDLYAGTGEIGFAATMRFDVQVLRPAAIQVLDGIKN